MTTLTDNICRNRYGGDAIELRDDEGGRNMHGHFAVFDQWTRIDSWSEGLFMERLATDAFDNVFRDTTGVRVLFEHGKDPSIGNKPLAAPGQLRSDEYGAAYDTELFDAPYANDLIPAMRAGQLGASFRFSVEKDEWVNPSRSTESNPDRIKERTIREVGVLYEYGPCPFGAYKTATTGIRSGTDDFLDHLLDDPLFLARYTERVGLRTVEQILSQVPDRVRTEEPPIPSTNGHEDGTTHGERGAFFRSLQLSKGRS